MRRGDTGTERLTRLLFLSFLVNTCHKLQKIRDRREELVTVVDLEMKGRKESRLKLLSPCVRHPDVNTHTHTLERTRKNMSVCVKAC